jgi:microcystin-dependent protein
MDFYIAQIFMFGGNFAPRSTAFCDGQILSIAANTALFSLLGTTYGGDGRTTFALPDLRGRVPMGAGNGPGLTPRELGERGGTESITLTTNQLPSHTHVATLNVSTAAATATSPSGNVLAAAEREVYAPSASMVAASASAVTVQPAGGGQPFSIVQPYLVISFCIATQGIFPSRN